MKHRHFKALTSLLLVVVMIASMLPVIPVTAADTPVATFTFGDNGSASHVDGNDLGTSKSYTEGSYTLSLTGMSKVYGPARDAKGNSCLKLGTNSAVGKFSFTVPSDVTSVKIYVAKYKSNTTKVTVNNATTTLTKNSNDGAYDVITVDTSSTKTVSLTTVSGGARAMVDKIEFYGAASSGGDSGETPETPACEHPNKDAIGEAKDATCIDSGITAGLWCPDCEEIFEAQATIPALGHNYGNDGVCTRCGDEAKIFKLVTKVDQLYAGAEIIIVAANVNYALGTQSSNNFKAQAITKSNDSVALADGVQVITLEISNNMFAFKVGTGYLYASGGTSSNQLKITNTLNETTAAWNISITEEGIATIKANVSTSDSRNWMRYNSNNGNPIFSCYGSGQQDICIYMAPCAHTDATEYDEQPATCEANGHSAYKHCNICGEDIGKIVYQGGCVDTNSDNLCDRCTNSMCVEHVWEDVKEVTPATCTTAGTMQQECSACHNTQEIEIPALDHDLVDVDATPATCTTEGKEAGKKCQRCDYYEGRETIPATGHTYVDLECTKCGDTIVDHSGVYYIATIRKQDGNYFYMTSDLGDDTTKRYTAVDSGLTELPAMITETEDTYVFVLEINEDGTYCIRALGVTGDNYLDWTSGNSGILVAKDKALHLNLTENEDGTISLHSGSRYLSLNGTTGNDYFAFYEGTQKQNLTLIPAAAAPELKNYSVSLDGGVTINLEYNVSAAWLELNPNAYVEFASNFGTTRIPVKAGVKTYSVSLTPKAINSAVSFTLSDGANVVETYKNVGYSNYEGYIRENAATNEEFQAAIDLLDMINQYTAAANGTLEEGAVLTDDFFLGASDWKAATGEIFEGVYANLGEKVNVRFEINTNIDYTGYKVTVVLGEVTLVDNDDFANFITSAGELAVVGLAPTHLNDTLTVTVTDTEGNESVSSFVFNDYLKAIYKDADQATKNLIVATYQYGVAAENYNK